MFKFSCPDGNLYKSKVEKIYSRILPSKTGGAIVDHIFRVFDNDSNGFIDFKVISGHFWREFSVVMKEFMIATDMTTSGSLDEKLRWTFKIYDEDGSGEVILILRTKYWQVTQLYREWYSNNGEK